MLFPHPVSCPCLPAWVPWRQQVTSFPQQVGRGVVGRVETGALVSLGLALRGVSRSQVCGVESQAYGGGGHVGRRWRCGGQETVLSSCTSRAGGE